jgi:hypothetical protein
MAGAPGPRTAREEGACNAFHSARMKLFRQFSSPHGTAPTKSVTINGRRKAISTHPESAEADSVLKCPGYQQWQFLKSGIQKESRSDLFRHISKPRATGG